jgi:nucleotide-binding universal stress UspA family protein
MLEKILVPIDGSEAAWHALEYACRLGEKFNSEITIVHVVQPHYTLPVLAIHEGIPFVSVNIEEVETTGYQLIEFAKSQVKDYPTVETLLEFGHPAEQVLALAKTGNYNLIVIGSRGLSAISEFFLGSVSSKVSQYSTIPVMIVK